MKVLRWIAVLPAALLAAVAIAFPVHWFVVLINASPGVDGSPHMLSNIPPAMLERFGIAFFAPFAFIMVGAYVAPRFKLATAAGLAGLLVGVLLVSLLVLDLSSVPLWQRGLTWAIWAGAIAAGMGGVWKKRQEREPSNVTGWN